MLDAIIMEPELFSILRSACKDNEICVKVCENLQDENGDLREDLIQILKVDEYFNSKWMHNPPPSIDCLIIVKTGHNQFGLTLVELKNVSSAKMLKPKDIRPKFDTTIKHFLSEIFAPIFLNTDYSIAYFRLWLVTNPYRWPPMTEEQYRKKLKGTVLEMYLSDKPYRFRNLTALIEHKPPNTEVCI